MIKEGKKMISMEDLCAGLPKEFLQYMNYCRELKFEEKPDYDALRRSFKELFF